MEAGVKSTYLDRTILVYTSRVDRFVEVVTKGTGAQLQKTRILC